MEWFLSKMNKENSKFHNCKFTSSDSIIYIQFIGIWKKIPIYLNNRKEINILKKNIQYFGITVYILQRSQLKERKMELILYII